MAPDDPIAPRVLFVITSLGVGGAETQLLRIAGALVAQGWAIEVVALRDVPGMQGDFDRIGVPVTTLLRGGARARPALLAGLAAVVRRFGPDCLVTLLFQANVLGRLVGAWCRVPVVSSIRNTRFGGGGRFGGIVADALERATGALAASVVVNSALAGEALLARRVVRASTLRVIPNALPARGERAGTAHAGTAHAGTTRARERAELGLAEGAFAWITVGRLEPQKNHHALLHAFAALARERPEARLLVVGAGAQAGELATSARDLGVEAAVSFLGLRRDVERLLALADAFVLASGWEGLPNVVMEALAAGLPTIGTPVGGVPELLDDGVTGWLAASPAAADLYAAMGRVMAAEADERAAIAAAGQRQVMARYGLEAAVEGWRGVILAAIGDTATRRRRA